MRAFAPVRIKCSVYFLLTPLRAELIIPLIITQGIKDLKKILKYTGIGLFVIGGISLLLTAAEVASFIGAFSMPNGNNTFTYIINFVTISIFCFVVGWIFVDVLQ